MLWQPMAQMGFVKSTENLAQKIGYKEANCYVFALNTVVVPRAFSDIIQDINLSPEHAQAIKQLNVRLQNKNEQILYQQSIVKFNTLFKQKEFHHAESFWLNEYVKPLKNRLTLQENQVAFLFTQKFSQMNWEEAKKLISEDELFMAKNTCMNISDNQFNSVP